MQIVEGARLTLDIERVAHGGHFIAYAEGLTIFVRGAVTGERVVAEITQLKKKIAFAEVVEVIAPSSHRLEAPCHYFRERVCGGCDFQHIEIGFQRELKRQVVVDSFRRIAGIEIDLPSLSGPEPESGFHWRTRMDFTLTPDRRVALHPHRSDSLTEITSCLIAAEGIKIDQINQKLTITKIAPWERVRVGVSSTGDLAITGVNSRVQMQVDSKRFDLSLASFWQPHIKAAETLVAAMQSTLDVCEGDLVLDLYGGVGLFAAFLRDQVGQSGKVILVESDKAANSDAERIFGNDRRVSLLHGRVEDQLRKIDRCDLILLDPPRTGVGGDVIAHFERLAPRQILYISCDPATLARDTKALVRSGYRLASIKAFDLFPMTEHIESVAHFIRAQ